jgi:hypothetical protein
VDSSSPEPSTSLEPAPVFGPVRGYLVGLDLGQTTDYSALCVVEQRAPAAEEPGGGCGYHVRHLQRWPLGTPYPAIVKAVATLLTAPQLAPAGGPLPRLVVDQTGVGRAVVDLFCARPAGLRPVAVTITGGAGTIQVGTVRQPEYHTPKRDLVGVVQVLLQQRRLAWARALPDEGILAAELANFKVTISAAGRDTYGAGPALSWREGAHDDYVLAVALAVWFGKRPPPKRWRVAA